MESYCDLENATKSYKTHFSWELYQYIGSNNFD
jgi:hypothetical protein